MKKSFFGTLYLVALSLIMVSCGGSDRAHQLKVLNWADYIDENVKTNIETWYYEQTGEKVELVYETDLTSAAYPTGTEGTVTATSSARPPKTTSKSNK